MSKVTISAIKADVGGYVGHSAVHPDLLASVDERVRAAIADGLLLDGRVGSCGDDLNLVLTHERGVDDGEVHRLAWETFVAATDVAKRLHLYGAGQDLLADAFSGNIRGAGPGVAEMEIEERPSEPFVVFAADKDAARRLEPAALQDLLRPLQHSRARHRLEDARSPSSPATRRRRHDPGGDAAACDA